MADDCIFCRVVAGDAPAYVVAEDDATVAFLDRGQATEGHTLVVPRAHSVDIWEIVGGDLLAVAAMAKRVAHLLDRRLRPDGLNLTQSNRPAGWQERLPLPPSRDPEVVRRRADAAMATDASFR